MKNILFFLIFFLQYSFGLVHQLNNITINKSINLPTEIIANIKLFLNEFKDIKDQIFEVKKQIEKNKNNSELLNILRSFHEILIETLKQIEIIEKNIINYEQLIDVFVTERLFRINTDESLTKNNIEYIKKIFIDIFFIEEEIKNLDDELNKINNEKAEQDNNILSNEHDKNEYQKIIKDIIKYQNKLNKIISKKTFDVL